MVKKKTSNTHNLYSKGGENGIFWEFLGFFKKVGGGGRRLKKKHQFYQKIYSWPKITIVRQKFLKMMPDPVFPTNFKKIKKRLYFQLM